MEPNVRRENVQTRSRGSALPGFSIRLPDEPCNNVFNKSPMQRIVLCPDADARIYIFRRDKRRSTLRIKGSTPNNTFVYSAYGKVPDHIVENLFSSSRLEQHRACVAEYASRRFPQEPWFLCIKYPSSFLQPHSSSTLSTTSLLLSSCTLTSVRVLQPLIRLWGSRRLYTLPSDVRSFVHTYIKTGTIRSIYIF